MRQLALGCLAIAVGGFARLPLLCSPEELTFDTRSASSFAAAALDLLNFSRLSTRGSYSCFNLMPYLIVRIESLFLKLIIYLFS